MAKNRLQTELFRRLLVGDDTPKNYFHYILYIMKDYTVVFNSRKFATGAVRNDLTYQFDWSQFPADEDYYVSFTYNSEANDLDGTKIAQVFIDIGGSMYAFETAPSNYANRSLFLGTLYINSHLQGTTDVIFLASSDNQNGHIYLMGRPTNQSPRIQILDGAGAPFLDANGDPPSHYILALSFQPVPK